MIVTVIYWVVHVDYDNLSKVILDQAVFYVVPVDYYVFSEVNCDQTAVWVVDVDYDDVSLMSIVTRDDVLRSLRRRCST